MENVLNETLSNDSEVFELLSSYPINLTNLLRFYSFDINFTNEELLKLIKDLDYLDNIHLYDVIFFARYQDPKFFLENLDDYLLPIYHDDQILNEYLLMSVSKNNKEYVWLEFDENEIKFLESRPKDEKENPQSDKKDFGRNNFGKNFIKFTYTSHDLELFEQKTTER